MLIVVTSAFSFTSLWILICQKIFALSFMHGCLGNTGFCQNKVNYHRWIINIFIYVIYQMLYLNCLELHIVKLH